MKLMLLLIFNIFTVKALPRKRILGGDEAKDGEYTYEVALIEDDGEISCCGGIIGEQHILTAGHCFKSHSGIIQRHLTAVIGTTNYKDKNIPAIKLRIETVYLVKKYKPNRPGVGRQPRPIGDIAVIKLEHPIENHLKFLKLNIPKDPKNVYIDEIAVISGFGYDEIRIEYDFQKYEHIEVGSSSGKLRYAKAKVLSDSGCNDMYPCVDVKHLCARIVKRSDDVRELRGTCVADSGSPLVLNGEVIGVLNSSPRGCNEIDNSPSVYARVTEFIDFIENSKRDIVTSDMCRLNFHLDKIDDRC